MTDVVLLAVSIGTLYLLMAAVVARKSCRWNRGRERSPRVASAIAVGAGLLWPLTIWFWEADWLTTGRRSWRGDR